MECVSSRGCWRRLEIGWSRKARGSIPPPLRQLCLPKSVLMSVLAQQVSQSPVEEMSGPVYAGLVQWQNTCFTRRVSVVRFHHSAPYMRPWWNGRHAGLRNQCFGVGVQIPPGVPLLVGGGRVDTAGTDPLLV